MDLSDKIVLVTGAAGSIGSALVSSLNCKSIRALDTNETGLHYLGARHPSVRLLLGDVRDRERMRLALSGVDVCIHAAALKHVGLGEYNCADLVSTNVGGTVNVAGACHENGVKRLLLVSTDKASEPTCAMGASKMLAERVVLDLNAWSSCEGQVVRFGNVFGSRGSVVPTLLRQLARENKATITHPEMTRFTMGIDQAVGLVAKAAASDLPRGSTVVLKMQAYRLDDLGYAVVTMWNETHPDKDKASLVSSGAIRAGEKMHESLMSRLDMAHAEARGEWFVVHPSFPAGIFGGPQERYVHSQSAERVERWNLVKAVKAYLDQVDAGKWE